MSNTGQSSTAFDVHVLPNRWMLRNTGWAVLPVVSLPYRGSVDASTRSLSRCGQERVTQGWMAHHTHSVAAQSRESLGKGGTLGGTVVSGREGRAPDRR